VRKGEKRNGVLHRTGSKLEADCNYELMLLQIPIKLMVI
jgi:hypothetical protein